MKITCISKFEQLHKIEQLVYEIKYYPEKSIENDKYIDVFKNEPLSEDNKLWEFNNVIITHHNSRMSYKNKERTFNVIYNNLKNYKESKKLNNIINIDK